MRALVNHPGVNALSARERDGNHDGAGCADPVSRAQADATLVIARLVPAREVAGRYGTEQRQHFRLCWQGALAGPSRLVAQQPIHALFGAAPI